MEKPLGEGGMGSVYRCHNRAASRILAAVKVLDPALGRSESARLRFIREAEILSALDHPSIVKVRNVRMEGDLPYLEMELIQGESLDMRIARGAMDMREAMPILLQAADALVYLHALGVRHRDIKPSNLLLQEGNRLKLVDFGIATEEGAKAITLSGQAFGSVSYAPPEWINPQALDPVKWDIYALGVVFYELLTGRPGFPASSGGTSQQQAMQVMMAKQGHPPLDPGRTVPEPLRALIRAMTCAEPNKRTASAKEVKERLEEISGNTARRAAQAAREYEFRETLGTGGFGTVYRARFLGEGGFSKEVALKVLHPHMADQQDVARRLRDEARMLGLLHHRAIVQVDRLTRLGGRWALVMEYVRGADLNQILKERGPTPVGAALEIIAEVAGALHSAYSTQGPDGRPLQLLHRDIKPSNIRLTPFGEVKILDFGIARANFKEREAETGALAFGSPGYFAPERLDLEEGPESDVYSLGVVLYELLQGEPFGTGPLAERRLNARVQEALQRLRDRGVPEEVVTLVGEMMAFNPTDRPSSRDVERRCLGLRARVGDEPLRYWAEAVVTGIVSREAVVADRAMTTGEMSGSVVREGDSILFQELPTPDPNATLQDAASGPNSADTLYGPESNGATWYPGVVEQGPIHGGATIVPTEDELAALTPRPLPEEPAVADSTADLPAEDARTTPPPEPEPRAAKPVAEPARPVAEPARPVAEPAKPVAEPAKPFAETAKPVVEPARPVVEPAKPAPPSQAPKVLAALALLLGVGGAVWWFSRPPPAPPAPALRPVEAFVTGLSAGTQVALMLDGTVGTPIAEHAYSFPGVKPGAHKLSAVLGEGCELDPSHPWCGIVDRTVTIEAGDGVQSIPVSLSPPVARPVKIAAPKLGNRSATRRVGQEPPAPLASPLQLTPGRYPFTASAGSCEGVDLACAATNACPPGCVVWTGELVVPWGEGELPFEVPLEGPAAPTGVGKPPPEAAIEPTGGGPGKLVTNSAFASWLGKHPEWQRDAALAEGKADEGYLKGWSGTTPPAGKEGEAVVNVSWNAAQAFCGARGGLADLGAEPLTWGDDGLWMEWRASGGAPAWRRNDGDVSSKVARAQTNSLTGFRCAR